MYMFLFGVVFTLIIYPFLEDIIAIINQIVQLLLAKIAVKTVEYNVQMNELSEQMEQPEYNTQAIGFQIPSEDYYYYDEEE